MSDLVQNTAQVVQGSQASIQTVVAGEAINIGQPVYQGTSGSNTRWFLGKASGNVAQAGSSGAAVALTSAAGDGQQLVIFRSGDINLGATLTNGVGYVYSHNVGKIAPITDLVSTDYVTLLGFATNTSNLRTPRQAGVFATNTQHA